jgi:hypothetical protein
MTLEHISTGKLSGVKTEFTYCTPDFTVLGLYLEDALPIVHSLWWQFGAKVSCGGGTASRRGRTLTISSRILAIAATRSKAVKDLGL